MDTRIKICGLKYASEVRVLDELRVTYAGLWYGIPKGRHNLNLQQLIHLTSQATQKLKFVLVTMQHNLSLICDAVEKSDIYGIQLHGFQLPSTIKNIKQVFGDTIKIFKVLHVKDNICVEDDLIERYVEAGTDVLILDSYQDKQQIGSTGIPLNSKFISDFFKRWESTCKIMIAGGINKNTIENICFNHQPYGVDIDSAARSNDLIKRECVRNLMLQLNWQEKIQPTIEYQNSNLQSTLIN